MNRAATGRPVLLLVEDNPFDETLTLRAFGRQIDVSSIVVARDGVEALAYLIGDERGESPGELPVLVLLDLNLPRMDGFEVLRRLRSHHRSRLVPVVVLSSSLDETDRARCYALGANSYVRKPVDFREFIKVASALSSYWLEVNQPPPVVAQVH
jgi:two-component system response regulator